MTEEERNPQGNAPSPEASAQESTPPAQTETAEEREVVEDLAAAEDIAESEVAEDLGTAAVKGPAFDQDEGQVQTDTERNRRKERVGLVVSDVSDKTVTVTVETLIRHKKYKKRVRRTKKFMVHDEANAARVGDTVRIIETRPLSKRKRWRLANVISRAE
ncbi:30S ribosomal protein S17 [Rubrobacter radiotolerans]|uniref:Small ribosomal subunit protein uS17 n=1 Tax=Rubrobacter radiotolerans TaxID=42256 RepID=A0A023X419_RUBRA|nr:30S ribosomal protein S17 [Rubrobacter radiotolerans]SMC06409.1 small subunit ribosomal protein S17 [Rubrobacter radiotolerans DSM 5868]